MADANPRWLVENREKLDELRQESARLFAYFLQQAEAEGVQLNPNIHDDRHTILLERVYDEGDQHRHISIILQHDAFGGLDAFTKLAGADYEVELLYISTNAPEQHYATLWTFYRSWMHECTDRPSMDALIEANRPSRPQV